MRDRRLTSEGARGAALRAAEFARAAGGRGEKALAPAPAQSGEYQTPVAVDLFTVSLGDKVFARLRAEEALHHDDVKVTQAAGARCASTRCSRPRTAR